MPSSRIRVLLKRWWIRLNERAGTDRFAQPAAPELWRQLEKHLPPGPGTFVEAGANDGYTQSNTYFLETRRGWRGLLVEPIPALAARCRRWRRRSLVVEAALVPRGHPDPMVRIAVAGLMSTTAGAFGGGSAREAHLQRAARVLPDGKGPELEVPAACLGDLIDRHLGGRPPDFLSLDVEGFELAALKGLDLPRLSPGLLLVETRSGDGVPEFLEPHFELITVATDTGTYRDLLFRRRD